MHVKMGKSCWVDRFVENCYALVALFKNCLHKSTSFFFGCEAARPRFWPVAGMKDGHQGENVMTRESETGRKRRLEDIERGAGHFAGLVTNLVTATSELGIPFEAVHRLSGNGGQATLKKMLETAHQDWLNEQVPMQCRIIDTIDIAPGSTADCLLEESMRYFPSGRHTFSGNTLEDVKRLIELDLPFVCGKVLDVAVPSCILPWSLNQCIHLQQSGGFMVDAAAFVKWASHWKPPGCYVLPPAERQLESGYGLYLIQSERGVKEFGLYPFKSGIQCGDFPVFFRERTIAA